MPFYLKRLNLKNKSYNNKDTFFPYFKIWVLPFPQQQDQVLEGYSWLQMYFHRPPQSYKAACTLSYLDSWGSKLVHCIRMVDTKLVTFACLAMIHGGSINQGS